MSDQPPSDREDLSPAGAPAEQEAVNRRWRLWASLAVAGFAVVGAGIGFVVIPAGQRENAHLSMDSAMRRAAGLEAGSPAVAQPRSQATSLPVSQVSWDPAIMQVLAATNTARGAHLAGDVCAACHGDNGLSASSEIPSLAGQSPYAIYKQLHDYRTGARAHPQMTDVAKSLAVGDLASIAALLCGRLEGIYCAWEPRLDRAGGNRPAGLGGGHASPHSRLHELPYQWRWRPHRNADARWAGARIYGRPTQCLCSWHTQE